MAYGKIKNALVTFIELIAVFIGIYLAFYVDKKEVWKQETERENEYRAEITKECTKNAEELEYLIKTYSEKSIALKEFIEVLDKNKYRDFIELRSLLYKALGNPELFVPRTYMWKSLIKSNSLKFMRTLNLLEHTPARLYDRYNDLDLYNKQISDYYDEQINPYILKNINFETLEFFNSKSDFNLYFRNLIYGYYNFTDQYLEILRETSTFCKKTKNLLANEIKND